MIKRLVLGCLLILPFISTAQFRLVGTGVFTTINDSTYQSVINFRPDLTGNSYTPLQVNKSMFVLSQRGQLYRIDTVYNKTFSTATLVVVEKDSNWNSPIGQIMVFQSNTFLTAPQAVFGSNSSTANMQATVDTWNANLLRQLFDTKVDTIILDNYMLYTDTISLSNRINGKVDTSTLNNYVKYTDTLSSIATKADLELKLNAADTVNYVKYVDTLSTIATKKNLILYQPLLSLTTVGTEGQATFINDTLNIPNYADTSIYNANGTLTGNRVVNLNTNRLSFIQNTTNGDTITIGREDNLGYDTSVKLKNTQGAVSSESVLYDKGLETYNSNGKQAYLIMNAGEFAFRADSATRVGTLNSEDMRINTLGYIRMRRSHPDAAATLIGRTSDQWVTNVPTGYGVMMDQGSLRVDTTLVSTINDDNLKLNISDTINMLRPYLKNKVDSIMFKTTYEANATPGEMIWNSQSGTIHLGLNANVEIPIGQGEVHMVRNVTGTNIPKGSVVYISGSTGQRPQVSLANAKTEITSSVTFGVTAEEIIDNNTGFVVTSGYIKGINTSTLTEGQAIWLDTIPGKITKTKHKAPIHAVLVGYVVRAANNGTIFVKIQNGYELDELHNVLDTMKVNKSVLYYDTLTNLWKASTTPGIFQADTATMLQPYLLKRDTVSLSNRINTKQDIITGAASTVTTSNLTPSSVLISNVFGKIAVSPTVDSTELSYLDGVTSAIQTQLNNKQNTLSLTTIGNSGASTLVGSTLNIPNYTLSGLGGEPAITAGTTSQYWRGDKTWQTLNTTAVTEGTNLYFTNTRARDAISLTTNNSSGAATYSGGVLNIPNYTLSGLGGISLTSLSASAPLSYNNGTGAFSITQANGSTNGFLSSTDWTTFNNKQNALGFTPANSTTTISTTSPLSGGGDLSANRTLSLASAYGDTQNPYGTKLANTVLAGPTTGSVAAPTFRSLVAADIPPSITSNTTGTASNVTGTVSPANGGTGLTTFGGANRVPYSTSTTGLTFDTTFLADPSTGNFVWGGTSMPFNVIDNENIFIGKKLNRTRLGSGNVLIGTSAGSTNMSGTNNNVLIGFASGLNITSGSVNNIILGTTTGNSITSGSNNIIIGNSVSGQTLTTGSGNILIGNNIRLGSNITNSLTVGNLLFGVNMDSMNISIPVNGRIGIRNNNPQKTLHVDGEVRITDLDNGIATRLVGATNDGDIDTIAIGSGLTLSSGTLSATSGVTITSSGASVTLTNTSQYRQIYTGSLAGNFTYFLPRSSTLTLGQTFEFKNDSPGTNIEVVTSTVGGGGNSVAVVSPRGALKVVCISTAGANAVTEFDATYEGSELATGRGRLVYDSLSTVYSLDVQNDLTLTASTFQPFQLRRNTSTNGSDVQQLFQFKNSSGNYVIYSAVASELVSNTAGSHTGKLKFYTKGTDSSNPLERLVILEDGNVGIGTTSPATKLNVNGAVFIGGNSAPDANYYLQLNNNSAQKAKANAWDTYSDARIKTQVQPIVNALETINKLNPVTYKQHNSTLINDSLSIDYTNGKQTLGFIAQEVINAVPQAVSQGSDKELWSMDYSKLIPILTKALQEQQVIIEQLKERIIKLENK